MREKALAALRNGITTIVIPERNVPDLREVPKELKKRITFVPVRHMREVLEHVLVERLPWRSSGTSARPAGAPSGSHAPAHATGATGQD